jgi:hypothetical protein
VIRIWIHMIDTNCVNAELLHQRSISFTLLGIDQWVV